MSVPRGCELGPDQHCRQFKTGRHRAVPQWEDGDAVLHRNDRVSRLNGECVAEAPAAWIGMALNK
jgi:hypothetical protein